MKLKALLLALFTAGLLVSAAFAATPEKKGKSTVSAQTTGSTGTTTGTTGTTTTDKKGKASARKPECKPARKLQLHGTFAGAVANGFAMAVTHANKGGKELKGKQVTVVVDDKTRFRGKGRSLAGATPGDRVSVQGYACKANLSAGTILARQVHLKSKKDDDDEDDAKTTGTTSTGTTTTTTTGTTTSAP